MTDVQHGEDLSTRNTRSAEIYDSAVHAFNIYRGDPVAIIDEALEEDPDFVSGHILRAQVHISMWERSVVPEVEASLDQLDGLHNSSNERERAHVRAIKQWASGDWDGMRGALDRLSAEHPRDLLALQIGHLSDFYHGDRENLRGRILRALPAWSREDASYGILLGMLAFGLEECGSYSQAEETGRQALEIDAEDCWAQHAVAHVMEMQGRDAEGIAFMESRQANWAQEDNGFAFHNWWHTALYNLDQGNAARALEIYDQGIRPEPSEIQLMMLDAAALLWRMHLQDLDVGDRWEELAKHYQEADEDAFYAFNDMHAMMSYVATGRGSAATALLGAVEQAATGEGTNAKMTREVGLPIVRAIESFGRGLYEESVDLLMPVRYRANIFGGSHAQRDIVHRTLIEAALRGGQRELAQALINERIALKPHCPFNWSLHRRAQA